MSEVNGMDFNLFYAIPDNVIVLDKDGFIVFSNKGDENLFQMPLSVLKGKQFYDLPFQISSAFPNSHQVHNALPGDFTGEIKIKTKEGSDKVYKLNINKFQKLQEEYFIVHFSDVTDVKYYEAEINLERKLFSGGYTIIIKWKPGRNWEIDYISPNVKSILGYNPEDITSEKIGFPSLVLPDDLERIQDEVQQYRKENRTFFEQEYHLRHLDGSYRYFIDHTSIVRDEQGNIIRYLSALVDMTERKNIEHEVRKHMDQFYAVIENIKDAVIISDASNVVTYCNSAAIALFGWKRSEIVGGNYTKLIPEFAQISNNSQSNLYAPAPPEGSALTDLMFARHRTGEDIPVMVTISKWAVENEQYCSCIVQDLREVRTKEAQLRNLASFPERAPMPIVEFNKEGIVTYANPEARKVFPDLVDKGYAHKFLNGIKEDTEFCEVEINGHWYRKVIIHLDKNSFTRVYGMDITENVLSKQQARFNEQRLLTLMDTLPDAVFFKDGKGRWLIINKVAERLFGLENINWVGKTDAELMYLNPPRRGEHEFCISSDESAWKSMRLSRGMESLIDDAGKQRTYDVLKVPVFNPDLSREGLVIVGREITEIIEAEEELRLNNVFQTQLNDILKLSLSPVSQTAFFEAVLDDILKNPFLKIENKTGIFISDNKGESLKLVAHRNLPTPVLASCRSVPFGKCVCGKAAFTKKTVFSSCIDDQHEIAYDKMEPHGHYAVPLMNHNDLLGVLVVYLENGHVFDKFEVTFLESVGRVIAGTIVRKQAEDQVIHDLHHLEKLDKINNVLQIAGEKTDFESVCKDVLETVLQVFDCDGIWLVHEITESKSERTGNWRLDMLLNKNGKLPVKIRVGEMYPIEKSLANSFRKTIQTGKPFSYPVALKRIEDELLATEEGKLHNFCIGIKTEVGRNWVLGLTVKSKDIFAVEAERKLFVQVAERLAFTLNSFYLRTELVNSESQYRSFTETARDIIVTYDLEGNIKYMNNVGLQFFGFDETNYKGENIFKYIPDEDKEALKSRFADRRMGLRSPRMVEMNFLNAKGESVPFEVNTVVIEYLKGARGLLSIKRNITERKIAEEKLVHQNSELKKINQELDRFVYSTSHDLRAPLTSVMGLIDLAKEYINEPEEMTNFLGMMESSVTKLDNVIRSILDYSKNNRSELKFEKIDIKSVYDEIMDGVSYLKGINQIKFNVSIDDSVDFYSDKIRLAAVLRNLQTNAIKYSKHQSGSFVNFTFECIGEVGRFTIQDNGPGIPKNKQQAVFEMFFRDSLDSDGSGLGLYIVKQNVERLEGTISLESEKNEGCTFVVEIPNRKP